MISGVEYLVARALISISGDEVELKNITTLIWSIQTGITNKIQIELDNIHDKQTN